MRVGIPALVVLAGLVSMAFGTPASLAGGGALIGAGAAIAFGGWLFRLGLAGDDERAAEERARREFDRTGRWPGR